MRILVLMAALAAAPAMAEDIDCANTEVQVELSACAEADWQAADKVLNDFYGNAMAAMKEIDAGLPKAEQGAAINLRNAQRAWVTYRDATCAAEGYAMHGGSAEPMVIYGCRARVTGARADELKQMVTNY